MLERLIGLIDLGLIYLVTTSKAATSKLVDLFRYRITGEREYDDSVTRN